MPNFDFTIFVWLKTCRLDSGVRSQWSADKFLFSFNTKFNVISSRQYSFGTYIEGSSNNNETIINCVLCSVYLNKKSLAADLMAMANDRLDRFVRVYMSGAGGQIGEIETISRRARAHACINDRGDDLVSRHGTEWAESRCSPSVCVI